MSDDTHIKPGDVCASAFGEFTVAGVDDGTAGWVIDTDGIAHAGLFKVKAET